MAGVRGYPPEFKAEATRLYRESGRSFSTIVKELGISRETCTSAPTRSLLDERRRRGSVTLTRL